MIMYFSATGNTKYCAEFISRRTNDPLTLSINDMMKNGVREIDCANQKHLGIFAPVYDWDMSYAVSEFLRGVTFKNAPNDCYIYGVFTCGSASGISIVMKDNRPSWTADKCACCLACLHRCPARAINKWRSAKNGRYLNPNVSL